MGTIVNSITSEPATIGYSSREKITVTHFIDFGGHSFEFYDLYEAVSSIEDHVLTNRAMIEVLMVHNVISDPGSNRWASGGSKGPSHADFMKILREYEDTHIAKRTKIVAETMSILVERETKPQTFITCTDTRGLASGLTNGRKYLLEDGFFDEERVRIYNDLQKHVWYDRWRFQE